MKPTSLSCPAALLVSALLWLAAPTAASAAGVGVGPSFKGPLGLQLYSLRDQFAHDVPGTLQQARRFGFKYVELAGTYGVAPKQFAALLKAHGLKAVSGHYPYERLRDDLDGVIREAKTFGLRYVGCPWIPHDGPFNEKTCRQAIDLFNHAGKELARHGLRFFYHVHGYEFQPYGDGTLLDLMMAKTNPKYVNYEMDVFWIVHPGKDPVKLLRRYAKRWELMHLKDMRKGVPTGTIDGSADVRDDVAMGQGQLDCPAILRAAKRAGVKWYFIEDESPSSVAQIPVSINYLAHVRW
jgi:sugar phosphate isomerase/epimerase